MTFGLFFVTLLARHFKADVLKILKAVAGGTHYPAHQALVSLLADAVGFQWDVCVGGIDSIKSTDLLV